MFLLSFIGSFFHWIANLHLFSCLQAYPLPHFWIHNASILISEQVRAGNKKQVVSFAETPTSQKSSVQERSDWHLLQKFTFLFANSSSWEDEKKVSFFGSLNSHSWQQHGYAVVMAWLFEMRQCWSTQRWSLNFLVRIVVEFVFVTLCFSFVYLPSLHWGIPLHFCFGVEYLRQLPIKSVFPMKVISLPRHFSARLLCNSYSTFFMPKFVFFPQ